MNQTLNCQLISLVNNAMLQETVTIISSTGMRVAKKLLNIIVKTMI